MTTEAAFEDALAITVSDEDESAVRHVELPHGGNSSRSARRRARSSVVKEQPESAADTPADVTDGDEEGEPNPVAKVQEKAVALADGMAERTRVRAAQLAAGPALWDVRPPTLAEVWTRGMDGVDHYESSVMKVLCFTWLLLVAAPSTLVFYALTWILHSWWRTVVACVAGWVISVWI